MRRNEREEKGGGKPNPTQIEHSFIARVASWYESWMCHRNLEDGRKGKSSRETSWDCISNQFEDGIQED